jgi:hypothetical protein
VTSLSCKRADAARLGGLLRGQWSIEICQADCACGM